MSISCFRGQGCAAVVTSQHWQQHVRRPGLLQVPRIHAVLVQPCHASLASRQVLPFKSDEQLQLRAGELRLEAIKLLAVALGDDMLAAEYLVLQLVSRSGAHPS